MHYLFLISLRLLINPFGNLFLLFTLFLLTLPFKNISWDNYIHMQLKEIIQRSYVLFTQFPQMLSCCKAKAQYYNQESTLIKFTNLIWLSQYYMYLCECLCVLICVYLVCAILTTYVGSCIHHHYQDTKFLLIVLVSDFHIRSFYQMYGASLLYLIPWNMKPLQFNFSRGKISGLGNWEESVLREGKRAVTEWHRW